MQLEYRPTRPVRGFATEIAYDGRDVYMRVKVVFFDGRSQYIASGPHASKSGAVAALRRRTDNAIANYQQAVQQSAA